MIELMDPGLAVAQSPGPPPDGAALLAIEAAQAAPTLQQALAQGGCGCASRGAADAAAILDAPAAALPLAEAILDDREPEYRRGLGGIGGRQTALWLVAPEAELLLDASAPAIDGKTVGPQSTTISSDGTSWVDSNGNGKYDEGEEIIVTGTRDRDVDEDGGGGIGYGGDPLLEDGNGTGTSGGGTGGPVPEPKDTPCVEASPDGVPLQDINREALKASLLIPDSKIDLYEHGVIIYVLGGVVMSTAVFTQNLTDEIDWNEGIGMLPDGAHIVAILHNHPNVDGITDSIPSTDPMENDDWDSYRSFLAWSGVRGITVDSNLLMYIVTKNDQPNEGLKTRVYDKTDNATKSPSCSLQ